MELVTLLRLGFQFVFDNDCDFISNGFSSTNDEWMKAMNNEKKSIRLIRFGVY